MTSNRQHLRNNKNQNQFFIFIDFRRFFFLFHLKPAILQRVALIEHSLYSILKEYLSNESRFYFEMHSNQSETGRELANFKGRFLKSLRNRSVRSLAYPLAFTFLLSKINKHCLQNNLSPMKNQSILNICKQLKL